MIFILSADAKDLIRRLLQKNPADRPTARQALSHNWFSVAPGMPRHPVTSGMKSALKSFIGTYSPLYGLCYLTFAL